MVVSLEAVMVRCLLIAFSCSVLAATSPSQTDATKEAQKQSVQGKVVDAKSGQPIRKVNVEVVGGAGQSYGRHSATTSADGTFAIVDITPGRYAVTLQHAGFVQTTSRGQAMLTLQAGQRLTGLVFQMQVAGVISGKIADMDGDPMAGVSVKATTAGRGDPAGYGTTNDLGEYRIADLRPGKYLVLAQPSSPAPAVHVEQNGTAKEPLIYVLTYYPGALGKSGAIGVDVRSGEEAAANFSVLTTRAYRVTGTVVGVPSGAMALALASTSGGGAMEGPEALREGNRFEYQNVLPGTYVAMLMVVKEISGGEQPQMQMVRLIPPIEVDKANVEGVQLHAEPGGQIRGRFRLDTGEKFDWTQLNVNLLPIADNAWSTAVLSGDGVEAVVATEYVQASTHSAVSSDGTFEMKRVSGGSYQLLIEAHSDNLRDYYTKSVILGGQDVADSGFAVNGGLYLEVVVSAKGATIEGNVVDTKGQPVSYGTVAVVPNSEHRARPDSYQRAPTDEHGHFIARGLNPGSYVVLAFEELHEDVRQPEFLKTYAGKGEKIEVKEGTRATVTAKIIPAETEAP